jgi:hypothetical protein
MATRRAVSEEQFTRIESADPLKRRIGREQIFRLVRTSVYLAMGAPNPRFNNSSGVFTMHPSALLRNQPYVRYAATSDPV